jgi:hypothetical protein
MWLSGSQRHKGRVRKYRLTSEAFVCHLLFLSSENEMKFGAACTYLFLYAVFVCQLLPCDMQYKKILRIRKDASGCASVTERECTVNLRIPECLNFITTCKHVTVEKISPFSYSFLLCRVTHYDFVLDHVKVQLV